MKDWLEIVTLWVVIVACIAVIIYFIFYAAWLLTTPIGG